MITEKFDQYIRTLSFNHTDKKNSGRYPYNIPSILALAELTALELHPNVTFIIGENGSGKSTLLEAIAVLYGFNPEGGSKNFNFATKDTHSSLYENLSLIKGFRLAKDSFFLRAESFYNVASNVDELEKDAFGGGLLDSYGGKSLHEQSHGESFMALALNRFRGKGLYILDEPEAALSPSRQLALLSRIHQLVEADSQLIIATHSPLLMAYPHAKIYNIDNGYEETKYTETDHYRVTKEFLMHPEKMLEMLFIK